MLRGTSSKNFSFLLLCLLTFAQSNVAQNRDVCLKYLRSKVPPYRDDCIIPLNPKEIRVYNNVIDGFLYVFTGEQPPPSATNASSTDHTDTDWLYRESSLDCMGMLVEMKNSLFSVMRYLWLAPSCQYKTPKDLQQALTQARSAFEIAMNILCRIDAHSPQPTQLVETYYKTKVGRLEEVMEAAIAVSESDFNAQRCNAPHVLRAATAAYDISREELAAQKSLNDRAMEKLREDLKREMDQTIRSMREELLVSEKSRQELVTQQNHTDRATLKLREDLKREMDQTVQSMREEFLVHEKGVKVLWLLEDMLDGYLTPDAEVTDQAYEHLLENVRNWRKSKNGTEPVRREPGAVSATSQEQDRISRKFAGQSEKLLLVLTNINAYLSSRKSSASDANHSGWLDFVEEYFNPLLVSLVSGHSFTLESNEYSGENFCFQYNHRDPNGFWGVSKKATSDEELRSKCSWKLVPIPEEDGNNWYYLCNNFNSSSASEPDFREQDKIRIRILGPENSLLKSYDERANESSVEKFVVTILSKSTTEDGNNVLAPTSDTREIFNQYGREILYEPESEIFKNDILQWELSS